MRGLAQPMTNLWVLYPLTFWSMVNKTFLSMRPVEEENQED
ncbi:MAG: hypothetical protein ACM3QZ_03685 [Solirubrobacterales bacterium]